MDNTVLLLSITAVSVGFIHTVLGPDHYIPFIALSKARKWSMFRTSMIVLLCGIGHVSSSLLIGFLGLAFGWTLSTISAFDDLRGGISGWLLIAFGMVYLLWGIRFAYRNKLHNHNHFHNDEVFHDHQHNHLGDHSHIHQNEKTKSTQWVLFLIFIFGPCEPLIPLIIYPASEHNYFAVILVSFLFAVTTILTMMVITLLGVSGLKLISVGKLERYIHVFASVAILGCGVSVKFLGL